MSSRPAPCIWCGRRGKHSCTPPEPLPEILPWPKVWSHPPYRMPPQTLKSDDPIYRSEKAAREAMVVVVPSTTRIPADFPVPLGPSAFANKVKAKGCNVVLTYAKAVQPPTKQEGGKAAGTIHPAYFVESIAVHFRRPGVRGWACWWKTKGSVSCRGAAYRDLATGRVYDVGVERILKMLEERS